MTQKIMDNLRWLGHDSFSLETGGKVIYFDPFQLVGTLPPADIILITHEHFDHCSPEDIDKIKKDSTIIITEPQSAAKLSGDIRTVKPGDSLHLDSIEVQAVPAYNTNKKFHPKANNWLGFIVTIDGTRLYHAGDTDYIPEMKSFETDIALLPVSGTYVMTAEEAARAALDLAPQIAVPMHFGAIVGENQDATTFAGLLEGKIPVKILQKR